jgi:hypothetical protein
MADSTKDKTLMVRYILGRVSPEERATLEERYFADNDLFEEMLATENELIDSYVLGQLSGPDCLQFESHFLATPELRERVKLARSLAGYRSESTAPRPPSGWWKAITGPGMMRPAARFAFAGVLLGLLAWGLWLEVGNMRLRRELERTGVKQARIEKQQSEIEHQIADLEAQIKPGPGGTPTQELAQLGESGQPMISLALASGVPRSGSKLNIVPVLPGVSSALLWLKIDSVSNASYSICLETPEGRQILKRDHLKPVLTANGQVVPVFLPSTMLRRGDYIVRLLRGPEEIDVYSFRVVPH